MKYGLCVAVSTLLMLGCGSSNDTSEETAKIVCVWEEAQCLKTICQGCIAGPYGSCPPGDFAYKTVCSEETTAFCRERNRAPHEWATSGTAAPSRYTRNLKALEGVVTCDAFRAGTVATSTESICSGVCED